MDTSFNKGIYSLFPENESKFDFDTTVNKLIAEIENRSWNISFTHDLQQTMKKHGRNVLPVKVLAICHPSHSGQILDKDHHRVISCMMPCRISIYQKSDGKTYVSRMNPATMAQMMDPLTSKVMLGAAADVEEIITTALETI